MPKVSKDKLSDPTVKAATFAGRAYKLHDGNGLFLHVKVGGKYWRFHFWLGLNARGKPKERLMALGVYPMVSLKATREARDDVREWWEDLHRHEVAFAERDLRRLEMYIFPHIGTLSRKSTRCVC